MAEGCSTTTNQNIINMSDEGDDDDINALFNRVASKLGWLEEQMDLQNYSSMGTKHKKTRKCSRKKQSASKENTRPDEDKNREKSKVTRSSRKNKSRKKGKQKESVVSKAEKCGLTSSQDPIVLQEMSKSHDNTNLDLKYNKGKFSCVDYGELNDDITSKSKNSSTKNSFTESNTASINYLLDQDLDELYDDSFSPLPNVRITRPKCVQECSSGKLATHLTFSCSISPLTVQRSPVDGGPSPPIDDSKSLKSSIDRNVKLSSEQNQSSQNYDSNYLENKNKLLEYNLVDSEESELDEDFNHSPKTHVAEVSKECPEHDSEFSQTGELANLGSNSPVENFAADVKFTDSPEPMKWLLSPISQRERPIKSGIMDRTNKVSDVESDDDCENHEVQSLKERLKQNWKTKTSSKEQSRRDDNLATKMNYRSSIVLDSSSEDEFESFLASIRTPRNEGNTNDIDDEDFINNESSSSDDDKYFHARVSQNDAVFMTSSKKKTNKELKKEAAFKSLDLDDDDFTDDSVFKTPGTSISKPIKKRPNPTNSSTSTFKTPISTGTSSSSTKWRPNSSSSSTSTYRTPKTSTGTSSSVSFLKSLGTPYKGTSSPSAYVNNFKGTRDDLIKKLFTLYNDTVFENKLPSDFKITWNKRMRKTAGFCYYSQNRTLKQRFSRIELSDKVCDSAERLRDTLIHELCHAAAWLIHGVSDGHGKFWKYWSAKANIAHPEIPIISRCHSYVINTKYKYECNKCGYTIGRHSKSLDTSKYRCGCCRGELVLRPQLDKSGKPVKKRAPSKFALYVKENYSVVKKDNGKMKHADIMRVLSQEFGNKAKISES